jgi:hypothetical protein
MKQVIHHGYAITVTAHSEGGVWRAHAIISWDNGRFDLDDDANFSNQVEAENHGVESGRHWVNNHLQKMRG